MIGRFSGGRLALGGGRLSLLALAGAGREGDFARSLRVFFWMFWAWDVYLEVWKNMKTVFHL